MRRVRAALLVLCLTGLGTAAPAYGGADVFVKDDGGLFVGSGVDEINRLDVRIKTGSPETAPTTLRVRDIFTELNEPQPDGQCVKTAATEDTPAYVDCEVTRLHVEVVAGPGDDQVSIAPHDAAIPALFYGDVGNDQLKGGGAADTLVGGEGDDFVEARSGVDQLFGEDGDDGLDGEGDSDLVQGGPGGDTMFDSGASGTDAVSYFAAAQGVRVTVSEGDRNDGENAGAERDDVGSGFERIQGSPHDDVIEGGAAGEIVNGSEGNDDLDGKGGADTVEGNEGDDTIRARDGAADAVLDCDSASSTTQGTKDVAIVDAAGVDPEPLRCESVQRPAGPEQPPPPPDNGTPPPSGNPPQQQQPPPVRLPAATAIPTISGALEADGTLTCSPGIWTGSPAFAYGWFATAEGGGPPRRLATGQSYKLEEDDEGGLVYCGVLATNAAGSVLGRSVLAAVPDTVRMPNVNGLSLGKAREKILDRTGGRVDLTDKGRSIDAISCELGGKKGDCERARLKPGDAYTTDPKRGKRLVVSSGSGGKSPKVRIYFYDAGKDEKLPPVKTERKYGDDCPIGGRFSEADRESFIHSLRGVSEAEASFFLTFRECRYSIRYDDVRGQDADPFVRSAETGQVDGERGVKLTVSRPRYNDLAIVPFHRRLRGRDSFAGANLERGPINPGIGLDGRLTTLRNDPNDVCFAVVEASTGRLVPGVDVRARAPSGVGVHDRLRNDPQGGSTNAQGVRCDSWRIEEEGTYRFTFVKRGDNGVDEEGYLDIKAAERSRAPFVTLAGREIVCTLVDCAQTSLTSTGTAARAAQLEVLAIVAVAAAVGAIVKSIESGRGVDRAKAAAAAAALAGPQPEASLYSAARESGVTPAVLTLGGTLAPSAAQPAVVAGTHLLANDGASLLANDGASVVPAKGGNVVAAVGKLIGQDGSGLIGQDGSGIVAGGAGNLIGQDGSGLIGQDGSGIVSAGAGNVVQIEGRAVLVDSANRLAGGAIVAGGAGNAIPVAPIVAGGAGN